MPSIQNKPPLIAAPRGDAPAPKLKPSQRPITKVMHCVEDKQKNTPQVPHTSVAQACRQKIKQVWHVLTAWLGAVLHWLSGGHMPWASAVVLAPVTPKPAAPAPKAEKAVDSAPKSHTTSKQPDASMLPAPKPLMLSAGTQTDTQVAPERPAMVDKGTKARPSRAATAPLRATLLQAQKDVAEGLERERALTQERDTALAAAKLATENKQAARSGLAAAERAQRNDLPVTQAALGEAKRALGTLHAEIDALKQELGRTQAQTRDDARRTATRTAHEMQAAHQKFEAAEAGYRTALEGTQGDLIQARGALNDARATMAALQKELTTQTQSGHTVRAEAELVADELRAACRELVAVEQAHRAKWKGAEQTMSRLDGDLERARTQFEEQAKEIETLTAEMRNARHAARATYKQRLSAMDEANELKAQMHSNEQEILELLDDALSRPARHRTPDQSVYEAVTPSASPVRRPLPPRYNRADLNEIWRKRESGEL